MAKLQYKKAWESNLDEEERLFGRIVYAEGLEYRRLFKMDSGASSGFVPRRVSQAIRLLSFEVEVYHLSCDQLPIGDHWSLVGECYTYETTDGQTWDE